MYEVMARRYRPAQFDDVVGQEHIAATLKNAILRDRVAHAYMFTGGHGCGKTTMARILAKALVCQNGPTPTPCGVCPVCVDVAAGRDSDVLEIDGASNNGIEQIRQLREQAVYVPTRARYKIYIIDEVHMLSDGAFNALLKTLEEPPRHVKFVLATTDPHKVPDTILSRCQRFDFRLVPQGKLSAFFRRLAGEEQASITDEALDAVAAFAGGSVRDGLVLLDQLLSFADGEVDRRDVESVRGVASAENVAGIFAAVQQVDVTRALAIVDEVASRGTNVGDFLDQLIDFGRDLMFLAAGGGEDGISAYGPARETLFALSGETDLETALLYLDVLTGARTRVRARALTNPLVALEMAVARLAGLGGITPVERLLERLGEAAPAETASPARPAEIPAPPVSMPTEERVSDVGVPLVDEAASEGSETGVTRHQPDIPEVSPAPLPVEPPADSPPEAPEEPEDDFPFEPTEPPVPPVAVTAEPELVAVSDITMESVTAKWSAILDELAEKHPADFRHMLRIGLDSVEDGALVLSGSATAIEAWEDPHRRRRLEEAVGAVLGAPARFRFVAARKSARLTARPAADSSKEYYELARHPAVDRIRSLFDGVIVDCRPTADAVPAADNDGDEDE